MTAPVVHALLHQASSTICYIVACPVTKQCAVIDSVLDFDLASGRTGTEFVETIAATIDELELSVQWVLESHVHADHLSGAPAIKERLGGQIGIGDHIGDVQAGFAKIYNLGPQFQVDGSQFDHLFRDGETQNPSFFLNHVAHYTLKLCRTPGWYVAELSE